MYFNEILLYFIPFFFTSLVHLYFCLTFVKKSADVLKLFLMPLLLIPVIFTWFNSSVPLLKTIQMTGVLLSAWAGDYFLIKPVSKKKFFYGLIAFFLSHLGYASLFVPMTSIRLLPLYLSMSTIFLYTILTAGIYFFIGRPKGLRGAAAVIYTALLFLLQYLCFSPVLVHFFVQNIAITPSQYMLICGVLLFTISDIILAYSLFKREFKYSRFLVMLSYILAQFLLVYGILLYHYNM